MTATCRSRTTSACTGGRLRAATRPRSSASSSGCGATSFRTSERSGGLEQHANGQRAWEPSREHGFHELRHFYASERLEAGESVVSLTQRLGHADPGFMLRKYAHFLPRADTRGTAAVDALFGDRERGQGTLPGSEVPQRRRRVPRLARVSAGQTGDATASVCQMSKN